MHDIFILARYYMMTSCKYFPSYKIANQVVFEKYATQKMECVIHGYKNIASEILLQIKKVVCCVVVGLAQFYNIHEIRRGCCWKKRKNSFMVFYSFEYCRPVLLRALRSCIALLWYTNLHNNINCKVIKSKCAQEFF